MKSRVACLAFFLILSSVDGAAFTDTDLTANQTYEPMFHEHPAFLAPAAIPLLQDQIRVHIFPHIGQYTTPQGRDNRIDEITIQSNSLCKSFSMSQNQLLDTSNTMTFHYGTLNQPVRVVCEGAATLIREKGLSSYAYQGEFEIKRRVTADGKPMVDVINVLPFETYLKGVVPTEVPAKWPLETLKAQAVAARTYAQFEIQNTKQARPNQDFDVDDTVLYQAYVGVTKATPQTDEAVEATEGQVMTYQGKIIKAYFFSDSGGHTEDAAHVWGEEIPYCKAKPEVYDQSLVKSDWSVQIPLKDINSKLIAGGVITAKNPVLSLSMIDSERYPSGRVSVLHLRLKNGEKREIKATQLRLQLGLRSTLFSLKETGSFTSRAYLFNGRGYGHGAGMSQEGSKVLVDSMGWNYQKVLTFYYTDIEICTVKPVSNPAGSIEAPLCAFAN